MRSFVIYQPAGSLLIALWIVWSFYRGTESVYINNKWFPVLKKLPDKLNLLIGVFIVFETMFLIGDAVWFVEPFIRNLYSYLLSTLGLQGTQLGIGVLVLVIGLGAYCFKVKNQFAYGIVHIIFAISLTS